MSEFKPITQSEVEARSRWLSQDLIRMPQEFKDWITRHIEDNIRLHPMNLAGKMGLGPTPLTAKGELVTTEGTQLGALTVGSDGQVLTANSGAKFGLKWDPLSAITGSLVEAQTPLTTKGDLLGDDGTNLGRLAAGSNGQFLMADSGQTLGLAWASREFAYNEFTSDVSVTATSEGTANTVVTATAVNFDGSTPAMIEFFAYYINRGTSNISIWLYLDGSSIGRIGYSEAGRSQAYLARRLTPASGSRTYSIRASVDAGTGTVGAGAGGSGANAPGFIRITRAS